VKPRPKVALLILLAAAAGIIAAFIHKPAQPTHAGKPLSYWLRQHWLNRGTDSDLPEWKAKRDEAESAIRSIGTNAVPHLIAMANHDPPTWTYTVLRRLPSWVGRLVGESGILDKDPARDAEIGFRILGTNAQAAIPQMARLMADKTHPHRARATAVNLSYLGPAALPFITTEMSNNPPSEHFFYEWLITNNLLPTVTSRDQLPLLLNALENPADATAASNIIWQIAPHLLTNTPAQ
jgi:hypothetical protein